MKTLTFGEIPEFGTGYEGTFCSDRTFFQCSVRTCSVPFWQNIFFKHLGTLEHLEMFPGTFQKLFLKQKLQYYLVIRQKIQKIKRAHRLKISWDAQNYESWKFRINWMQKLHGQGVYVYFLLFEK